MSNRLYYYKLKKLKAFNGHKHFVNSRNRLKRVGGGGILDLFVLNFLGYDIP